MNADNPTLDVINNLHTTHGDFAEKPLPPDALQAILAASVRAASASNMQTYSVVVVEDRAVMKEVCGYQASVLLLYCIDTTRMSDLARHLGCVYSTDPAWMATTGAVDASLAAQTACIAATALGIDSLLTNGIHRGDPERVFRALDLPAQNCLPLIALLLGYAKSHVTARKGRLYGTGVVHRGRYHRCTPDELDALVTEYDNPERRLGLNQDFAKAGHTHYLEWFFKSWAKPFDPAIQPPSAMTHLLRRHGFIHQAEEPKP